MISPRVTLEEAKTDRTRKVIVIRLLGYQCGICGISEWMEAPIRLELDHIDGNADNNNLDNLRVLCPNCHSQTDTYKGANAGKNSARQQMRRKRYSEGKTY
ncbi:MAG: HNH endonuclease [Anaerolineae bacterium]|nr:HNH endonuclease [Anaerolineae bacterium]